MVAFPLCRATLTSYITGAVFFDKIQRINESGLYLIEGISIDNFFERSDKPLLPCFHQSFRA